MKSDSAITTVVSLTRNGLDYQFFQLLSERIDISEAEKKQPLIDLRDKLLNITREIDNELKHRVEEGTKLLNSIIAEEDVETAVKKHLGEMDEFFSQSVQIEFENARQNNDLARIEKIQKMITIIEKESAPPPEVALIQTLLEAPDDESRSKILQDNHELVNDNFLQTLNTIIAEGETRNQSPEMVEMLKSVYKKALKLVMEKNLKA